MGDDKPQEVWCRICAGGCGRLVTQPDIGAIDVCSECRAAADAALQLLRDADPLAPPPPFPWNNPTWGDVLAWNLLQAGVLADEDRREFRRMMTWYGPTSFVYPRDLDPV